MRILFCTFALILIIGLASCGEGKKDVCGCSKLSSKSVEESETKRSAKAGGHNSCNTCKPSGSTHAEGASNKTPAEHAGDKSCTSCHAKQ